MMKTMTKILWLFNETAFVFYVHNTRITRITSRAEIMRFLYFIIHYFVSLRTAFCARLPCALFCCAYLVRFATQTVNKKKLNWKYENGEKKINNELHPFRWSKERQYNNSCWSARRRWSSASLIFNNIKFIYIFFRRYCLLLSNLYGKYLCVVGALWHDDLLKWILTT